MADPCNQNGNGGGAAIDPYAVVVINHPVRSRRLTLHTRKGGTWKPCMVSLNREDLIVRLF